MSEDGDASLAYGQNPDHVRPDWETYFLKVMDTVAERANCDRGRAAAIIVKDKRIIATGYVGAPAGLKSCDEVGHLIKVAFDERGGQKKHCVRTTHAEMNAIHDCVEIQCNAVSWYVVSGDIE